MVSNGTPNVLGNLHPDREYAEIPSGIFDTLIDRGSEDTNYIDRLEVHLV